MRKLIITAVLFIVTINFATAQLTKSTALSNPVTDSITQRKIAAAGGKNITTRPFPSGPFRPSPELQRAFNWWLAVNPMDFGYTYDKLPQRQGFLDSAIYKFHLQTSIQFTGILPSPGLGRLQPDSLYHLMAMANLRDVYLSQNTMNSVTFQWLKKLPNLRSIGFPLSNIVNKPYNFTFDVTDNDIAAVFNNTGIENLHLAKCNLLTDNGFTVLKNNKKLKTISLTDCNSLTDKFFLTLEGCSQLETISFTGGANITMAALNNLRSVMNTLPALRTINFRTGSTLTSADFMAFMTSCRQAGFNVSGTW